MEQEDSRVPRPCSLGQNVNYHGPSSGGSSEYCIQLIYLDIHVLSSMIIS